MSDDLISREAAIEAIIKSKELTPGFMGMELYTPEDAIDAVNNVLSANQWIPCSERLPNEHGEYLVYYKTNKHEHIKILEYGVAEQHGETINNCWFKPNCDFNDSIYNNVIAWQPLPEPYVEVGNFERRKYRIKK